VQQLLAKQGTLCGDGLLLEENEDNSFNATCKLRADRLLIYSKKSDEVHLVQLV
jgi:hypothetical protein